MKMILSFAGGVISIEFFDFGYQFFAMLWFHLFILSNFGFVFFCGFFACRRSFPFVRLSLFISCFRHFLFLLVIFIASWFMPIAGLFFIVSGAIIKSTFGHCCAAVGFQFSCWLRVELTIFWQNVHLFDVSVRKKEKIIQDLTKRANLFIVFFSVCE